MADQNDQTEQDAVAAEWGRALENEAARSEASQQAEDEGLSPSAAAAEESTKILHATAKGATERVLSQEEIDSLLGFSLTDISLNDIFIADQKGDTLLSSHILEVNVDMLALIHGEIKVSSVHLDQFVSHINRTPDTTFNFAFIEKATP